MVAIEVTGRGWRVYVGGWLQSGSRRNDSAGMPRLRWWVRGVIVGLIESRLRRYL